MQKNFYEIVLYLFFGLYILIKIIELISDPSRVTAGNLLIIGLPFYFAYSDIKWEKMLKNRDKKEKE